MPLRVYLSYGLDPAETALASRLQTLAAAYGIEMFVPPWYKRKTRGAASVEKAIDGADYVLAIIASGPSPNTQNELEYALTKHKVVIPLVRSDLKDLPFLVRFPRVFPFSTWGRPGIVETKIGDFLKEQQVIKEEQQTISVLVGLALKLLLLFSMNKELLVAESIARHSWIPPTSILRTG